MALTIDFSALTPHTDCCPLTLSETFSKRFMSSSAFKLLFATFKLVPPENKTSYVVKGTTLFASTALNFSRKGQAVSICLTCSTHLENKFTAVERQTVQRPWLALSPANQMGVESGKQDEHH